MAAVRTVQDKWPGDVIEDKPGHQQQSQMHVGVLCSSLEHSLSEYDGYQRQDSGRRGIIDRSAEKSDHMGEPLHR